MNEACIIKDKKDKPKQPIKYDGKVIFEIDGAGNKDIEFCALDNFDNANQEFLVEIPLKKNFSLSNQLVNNINIQQTLNSSKGIKILLILNSPEFDVQRGAYMIENLIGFQRAFLPSNYTKN